MLCGRTTLSRCIHGLLDNVIDIVDERQQGGRRQGKTAELIFSHTGCLVQQFIAE